jgi:hypothetical protein
VFLLIVMFRKYWNTYNSIWYNISIRYLFWCCVKTRVIITYIITLPCSFRNFNSPLVLTLPFLCIYHILQSKSLFTNLLFFDPNFFNNISIYYILIYSVWENIKYLKLFVSKSSELSKYYLKILKIIVRILLTIQIKLKEINKDSILNTHI